MDGLRLQASSFKLCGHVARQRSWTRPGRTFYRTLVEKPPSKRTVTKCLTIHRFSESVLYKLEFFLKVCPGSVKVALLGKRTRAPHVFHVPSYKLKLFTDYVVPQPRGKPVSVVLCAVQQELRAVQHFRWRRAETPVTILTWVHSAGWVRNTSQTACQQKILTLRSSYIRI